MGHVLPSDTYEENRLRDRGFIDLLVLGVDLLELRGSQGEEGGNSRELKLVFDEYDVFMSGNLGKEEQIGRNPQPDWEPRRLHVQLGVLTKILTRRGLYERK